VALRGKAEDCGPATALPNGWRRSQTKLVQSGYVEQVVKPEREHLSCDDIRLVQQTFDRLWPTAQTTKLFYAKLFEIAPHIQPMFRNIPEMGKQGDKFTPTLAMLIWSLDDKAKLLPAIETLAKQHVQLVCNLRS
jgi:hypothetical protein